MTDPDTIIAGMRDQEHFDGYLDGYTMDCPEPNDNRHPRYVHSFLIGRSERTGCPIPSGRIRASLAALDNDPLTDCVAVRARLIEKDM